MSATAIASAPRVMLDSRIRGTDVEVWDVFEPGEQRRAGAAALTGHDVQQVDPSS
jgi:hypothetical protein